MSEYELLEKLFKKSNLTFQEIADKRNRNTCRKNLTKLAKEGLIKESIEKTDNAQVHRFTLTIKGRDVLLKQQKIRSVDLIDKGLELLENVVFSMDPEVFREIIDSKRSENWHSIQLSKKYKTPGQKVSRYVFVDGDLTRKFYASMFRLHIMLTRMRYPNEDCGDFVTVINGTEPLTIPKTLLGDLDFDLLAARATYIFDENNTPKVLHSEKDKQETMERFRKQALKDFQH